MNRTVIVRRAFLQTSLLSGKVLKNLLLYSGALSIKRIYSGEVHEGAFYSQRSKLPFFAMLTHFF